MADKKSVLIVKTGQSETFDAENNYIVSLGDVLRTTPLLHAFPPEQYEVTWLTERDCIPLLAENPYIHRLLVVTPFTAVQLMNERFDFVINLEHDSGLCSTVDRVPALRHYGFSYHSKSLQAYEHSENAIYIIADTEKKKAKTQSWAELLYEMIGRKYEGQSYVLGYKPKAQPVFDIGLNHLAGEKFPLKKWPKESWEQLAARLAQKYSVSWQGGTTNLRDYMEWIASCKAIVTNDSLGLHVALALRRKVVALFGPTLANEVADHPLLTKLSATDGDMKMISVEDVHACC